MAQFLWRWIALALVVLSGVAVLRIWDPAEHSFYPRCPLLSATGFLCPGCGSTRALGSLAHGDVSKAFAMNPLLVLAIPFLMAMICFPRITRLHYVPWAILILVLTYAVIRNLPFAGFSVLRP